MKTYSCYRQVCETTPVFRLRFEGRTACVCAEDLAGAVADLLDVYRSVNVSPIPSTPSTTPKERFRHG